MRRTDTWAIVLFAASFATAGAIAAPPPASPVAPATAAPQYPAWATWQQKDLIVKLDPLPKRYTCNALWYRFRDVLTAIGAKPGMSILVYPCEGKADLAAKNPSVHLQFFMPELLPKPVAGWAQFKAAPKRVELGPGHPASLDTSDCNLLKQMKDSLLESLAQHIDHSDLACSSSGEGTKSFGLTLDV